MLPLHDDNPTYRIPFLTIALILACVAVFLYQRSLPDDLSRDGQVGFTCSHGWVPANTLAADTPQPRPDGQVTCLELNRDEGRWWGLISYQFLHAGWLHLLGNMLFLWVFGNNIEDRLGRIRFVPFYLLCGVVAALAEGMVDRHSDIPMVGASGAVSGMLGAYLLLYPRAGVWTLVAFVIPAKIPAWLWIGFYFVMQVVYLGGQATGGDGGTAYLAHLAGFACGAALIRPLLAGRGPWPPSDAMHTYFAGRSGGR